MKKTTETRSMQLGKHIGSFIKETPFIKTIINLYSENLKIAVETKIKLLLEYILEDINNEALKELLEDTELNEESKEIFLYIIQKTIFSYNDEIKIFLLAKIYIYYLKNNELDYNHQTILTATDFLTKNDYNIIYQMKQRKSDILYKQYEDGKNYFLQSPIKKETTARIFLQKMLSMGFFSTAPIQRALNENENYYQSNAFDINPNYTLLVDYIIEYYNTKESK